MFSWNYLKCCRRRGSKQIVIIKVFHDDLLVVTLRVSTILSRRDFAQQLKLGFCFSGISIPRDCFVAGIQMVPTSWTITSCVRFQSYSKPRRTLGISVESQQWKRVSVRSPVLVHQMLLCDTENTVEIQRYNPTNSALCSKSLVDALQPVYVTLALSVFYIEERPSISRFTTGSRLTMKYYNGNYFAWQSRKKGKNLVGMSNPFYTKMLQLKERAPTWASSFACYYSLSRWAELPHW